MNDASIVSVAKLLGKSNASHSLALFTKTVLLITPPSVFLLDARVFMSLGILKVAAMLERAGCHVEHLDLSGIDNYLDVVDAHLRTTAAMAVGLTSTTPQLPAASKVIERVRKVRPDTRIILGGPHVTLVCAAVKIERKAGRIGRAHRAVAQLESLADVLVAGDGELAVFDALTERPPTIIDGDDPRGGLFMSDSFYDESPFPARHLSDVLSYKYTIDGQPATSLIAQLGCPFACNFCGGRNSKALRLIRTRTTASIVREIEQLYDAYGFTGWMLYDDELNVNKGLVELMNAIADLQARRGVDFRLRGFIKSELFTDEQAAAMYRAGFRWLLCGFEAADERILTNINKRATLADNTRVMDIADRHGLKVKALMSVGHAGESQASIEAVHDWLLKVRPADFDCTVITTYPGTPYYDEAVPMGGGRWTYTAKKTGDTLHSHDVDFTQVAEYYKGDPNGGYVSYVSTDYLSAEELVRLRDWVETDVRAKLRIPFNAATAAIRFEHSMGQGPLPRSVLRSTSDDSGRAQAVHGLQDGATH